MKNNPLVVADLTKRIAWGHCKVIQIVGFNPQGTSRYIQLHQAPAIAASDVPAVKGMEVPPGTWFDWSFPHGLSLAELTVAISTTQANYTAPAASGGINCSLWTDSDHYVGSGNTISGDLTTGVSSREVWADSAGPKKLLRLDVKNNNAATRYAWIVPEDAATAIGFTPATYVHVGPFSIATTATISKFFGKDGLSPYQHLAGTVKDGCSILLTDAADADTPFVVDTDFNIRALYE